jgi:glucosamine--fructose-6-phosphate aminotransferase (isomerizing)
MTDSTLKRNFADAMRRRSSGRATLRQRFREIRKYHWYLGKSPASVEPGSVILFPYRQCRLSCGLAGIVSVKPAGITGTTDLKTLNDCLAAISASVQTEAELSDTEIDQNYLGTDDLLLTLWRAVQDMKREKPFCRLYEAPDRQQELAGMTRKLEAVIERETGRLAEAVGYLGTAAAEKATGRLERLKDVAWALKSEILDNIEKVSRLISVPEDRPAADAIRLFRKINAVLNSIDRLEVRGRDSAGISLMFVLGEAAYDRFNRALAAAGLKDEMEKRCQFSPLINRSISYRVSDASKASKQHSLALTYKIALEIGSLGDNIAFLRRQIEADGILQCLAPVPAVFQTVLAHTRWASVGAITEPNCHPVDNQVSSDWPNSGGIIHTCLNGDIDNFRALRSKLADGGDGIHPEVTSDTKIIPLQIEHYLCEGYDIESAFRLAVNDFEGSHAIAMHTDLAPGRIFLAQRGSGQAIFVGLAEDHYMPASEVYGFTEETDRYLKLDGESVIDGRVGQTQGQIFILDQTSAGGLDGISAIYYDGSPLRLSEDDVKTTALTSRDIDRQGFSHYFLKEISESPASVESTLQNRWKIKRRGEDQQLTVELDDTVIPLRLRQALSEGAIRRVFFIGQGTAGVAALACANILSYYLNSPLISVSALKASEFSGFNLNEGDQPDALSDALIVAISQSGTTADTNRTVEMVKERGAYTLAIVNRRDSDITFKVDGVMYTSSGRDIEMSVASTKAFYSQIIAGALLGLFLARLQNRRDDEFVSNEIQQLRAIPDRMRQVLAGRRQIETSAEKLAVSKTFWAAVGSGPNKASADEIRIKLSELCYKTISSDYVEDKKHIDLSSEPLIIVCAAGTRPSVIGDIIKDTAIFKAHKATPIVIANKGEKRFDPYAADVIHVPPVAEHLAPILNTLVGHIWGYYAALAINNGSRFLYRMQDDVQQTLHDQSEGGLDIYEIILEQSFREKIARYYFEFRQKVSEKRFPTTVGFDGATDIMLLLKYLSGRLPVSDFELDFGRKGTPANMLNTLFGCLTGAISYLARPVDAIKHQAKTVTVGTSRVSERFEGVLFDILAEENFHLAQLTNHNIIVLKRLQPIIRSLEGSILYRIDGLNLLGEPGDETSIQVKNKKGGAAKLGSRVEKDAQLKGSKRTIVREGNVYIGKGRKDDRSILVIPILSGSGSKPGIIEYLLLLHINFMDRVPLETRIKALGGKYEKIKNIVQENSVAWSEGLLEEVAIDELFGRSAEKIAESIVAKVG